MASLSYQYRKEPPKKCNVKLNSFFDIKGIIFMYVRGGQYTSMYSEYVVYIMCNSSVFFLMKFRPLRAPPGDNKNIERQHSVYCITPFTLDLFFKPDSAIVSLLILMCYRLTCLFSLQDFLCKKETFPSKVDCILFSPYT